MSWRANWREYQATWNKKHPGKRRVITMVANARRRAKELGLPFDLTTADVRIPAVCPALGIPLNLHNKVLRHNSPTLDRVRTDRGYTKDNVAVVSHRANRLKSNGTLAEIEALAKWLRGFVEDKT